MSGLGRDYWQMPGQPGDVRGMYTRNNAVRSIGVVSAKGGVGKTSITVNLSAALMGLEKSVLMVDADIMTSGLGLQLGMYHFPTTLNDVLSGRKGILEALYIHSSGLRIIPASLCVSDVSVSGLKRVLEDPDLSGSIVMVDAPPGIERNAMAVLRACGELLIVTTPEIPSVADIMKTIKEARKLEKEVLGIVVNRYRKSSDQLTPSEIEASCGVPVIATISEDRSISKGIFNRVPSVIMNPYSSSSLEFKELASRLCGERQSDGNVWLKRILWKLKPGN